MIPITPRHFAPSAFLSAFFLLLNIVKEDLNYYNHEADKKKSN